MQIPPDFSIKHSQNSLTIRNIASFGAAYLSMPEMMCCQPLVEYDSWIRL